MVDKVVAESVILLYTYEMKQAEKKLAEYLKQHNIKYNKWHSRLEQKDIVDIYYKKLTGRSR